MKPTISQSIDAENNRHKRTLSKIGRFYAFLDSQVDGSDTSMPIFDINGVMYQCTGLNFMHFTMMLTPMRYGLSRHIDFEKEIGEYNL